MSAHDHYAATAGFHLDNPDADEVVVLLHGLGADRHQPLGLLGGLRSRPFTTVAADARAHGTTEAIGAREDFLFDAMVSDLSALLRRIGQGHKPMHLVGISMGAAIALSAGISRAFDVRSLTLIRPAFSDAALPSHLRVMADIGERLRPPADIAEERAKFASSRPYREVEQISALAAASLLSQFDQPLAVERSVRLRSVPQNAAYASRAALSNIEVPTLVVGTERDPVHPIALAREWCTGISGAQFVEVPPRDDDPYVAAMRLRNLVQTRLPRVKEASWT